MNGFYVEIAGHAAAVLIFTAVAFYGWQYRVNLRRNVQRSRFLYRLILITGVLFALINLARLYTLVAPNVPPALTTWMDLLSEYPSIIAQSVIIFYLLANKIIIERQSSPRRILAIGAHPDDFDVASGATLSRLHAAGAHITGLLLTAGQDGQENETRRSWQASDFMGVDKLIVLQFGAGSLHEHASELQQAISQVVREARPELVFTHSVHDQHADHRTVHAATLASGGDIRAILCYESPSATADFCPAFYVDAEEYVQVKMEALENYQGKRPKPYLHPESIRGQLAYRGTEVNLRYAEGFEVVRITSSLLSGMF